MKFYQDPEEALWVAKTGRPIRKWFDVPGQGTSYETLRALRRGDRSFSPKLMQAYAVVYERAGLDSAQRLKEWFVARRSYLERQLEQLERNERRVLPLMIDAVREVGEALRAAPAAPAPAVAMPPPTCSSCGRVGHVSYLDAVCPARADETAWLDRTCGDHRVWLNDRRSGLPVGSHALMTELDIDVEEAARELKERAYEEILRMKRNST